MNKIDFFRTPVWYPYFAEHSFLTSFVKLRKEELRALIKGETKGEVVKGIVRRMKQPMSAISGNSFVSVDTCAPTDTERFRGKHGAVHSAESGWRFLAQSEKVRQAAKEGKVEFLCIRPFRRMNQTREFRLFIHKGELKAMSQYWLVRHFRRLEGIKPKLWKRAKLFMDSIAWNLPVKNMVMDIYLTSDDQIFIIDLNPWGEQTDPLLLRTWKRDWEEDIGIVLMPPPTKISGNVNVSF